MYAYGHVESNLNWALPHYTQYLLYIWLNIAKTTSFVHSQECIELCSLVIVQP